ncbi:MAG: bifunctional phosphopantothenoylcysteine decarboxylase/phosphopantothenate--cysteine ligase CoaBC, partial [Chloroflexota bacterium]
MIGLEGKRIVLGITGSIAAYKGADLASKLAQAGAEVYTAMTQEAQEFITPLTFSSLTAQPVITEMFDPSSEFNVQHVTLGRLVDVIVVAPATAHIIAKIAGGLADDMLSLTVLASRAPLIIAPAMDAVIYENVATQENLAKLRARGTTIVGPGYGHLASGEMGWGRLEEISTIIDTVRWVLGKNGDMKGKKVVVTAGPTQEAIDPVRLLTNTSSGKMGYALAEAARDRGAQVVLVTGPTNLPDPVGVEIRKIKTAIQMKAAVSDAVQGADLLVAAAAVSDYRPRHEEAKKIKKAGRESLTVELERNPDILAEVNGSFLKVGFAAETEDLIKNATKKLKEKNLVLVAANDVTQPKSGFAVDTNRVTLINASGKIEELPLMTKLEVAHIIYDRIVPLLKAGTEVAHRPQSGTPSV